MKQRSRAIAGIVLVVLFSIGTMVRPRFLGDAAKFAKDAKDKVIVKTKEAAQKAKDAGKNTVDAVTRKAEDSVAKTKQAAFAVSWAGRETMLRTKDTAKKAGHRVGSVAKKGSRFVYEGGKKFAEALKRAESDVRVSIQHLVDKALGREVAPTPWKEIPDNVRVDEAMIFGSHDAYHSTAYGYRLGQTLHQLSLTGQMERGARYLDLRVYPFKGSYYLCHKACGKAHQKFLKPVGQFTSLGQALKEVADFLKRNKRAVIILALDGGFDEVGADAFEHILHTTGARKFALRRDDVDIRKDGWPTYGELRARGKRLICGHTSGELLERQEREWYQEVRAGNVTQEDVVAYREDEEATLEDEEERARARLSEEHPSAYVLSGIFAKPYWEQHPLEGYRLLIAELGIQVSTAHTIKDFVSVLEGRHADRTVQNVYSADYFARGLGVFGGKLAEGAMSAINTNMPYPFVAHLYKHGITPKGSDKTLWKKQWPTILAVDYTGQGDPSGAVQCINRELIGIPDYTPSVADCACYRNVRQTCYG